MSEERKHIEVVAAIIKKDNTILATQRGYGDLKDGWEFPGGKVEPGEAHEVALKSCLLYTSPSPRDRG